MKPYLIFNSQGQKYALDSNLVREIFLLPEITPLAETPLDIIGVLNFREQIIPIMHLKLRLGSSSAECSLNDSVIVLENDDFSFGMIVDNVEEVVTINPIIIHSNIDYRRGTNVNPAFISGIVKPEEEMIILLNPEALIRQPEAVETLTEQSENANALAEKTDFNFYQLYCPQATAEEQNILRLRADALTQSMSEDNSEQKELSPFAIVSMAQEYFGINLALVREFTTVKSLTIIPCCPKHIIGNMNLRGEILTLVDLSPLLDIESGQIQMGDQAIVIEVDDVIAGIPVDEVVDVIYLDSQDIHPIPMAVNAKSPYLQGHSDYLQEMVTILDLPTIIAQGKLVVNQTT